MNLQYIFELTGTALFAASGAIVANDKSNADWFGVTFLGLITCLGGGSVRDILLGAYPLAWVKDISVLIAGFTGIILAALFYNTLKTYRKNLFIVETFALGMFTIIGTQKALDFGVHPLIAAVMGMFSAVMGGVLRDVLTNEIPVLFRKEIYATACVSGALLYVVLVNLNTMPQLNLSVSALLIVLIRFVSVKYKLSLPKFRN
ncbi:MAG: trimeric intracellular cation channel family protein [Bacteroidetes bacterium]|nr:trimeric intracellular cation channel family protein [Bacteroidota bacterium]